MKIVNRTPLPVLSLPGKGPGDTCILTVIVKATFDMVSGETSVLSKEQLPILLSDELQDPKKGGSPRFEDDVAPFKPRTDVVVVGMAMVPGGKQALSLEVGFKVGRLRKAIQVFGRRFWVEKGLFGSPGISRTVPFSEMELVYEKSFGGMDPQSGDFSRQNPVGCGLYSKKSKTKDLQFKPLPCIEDPLNLIESWHDWPFPVGFGFVGKTWEPRLAMMGTYDAHWEKERYPERPADFSFEFFNAAPRDQQVEGYLHGDETIELKHLTPEGLSRFQLPGVRPTVTYGYSWEDAGAEQVVMHLDTLCLLPAENRLYLVWRGAIPMQNLSAEEIKRLDFAL